MRTFAYNDNEHMNILPSNRVVIDMCVCVCYVYSRNLIC